MSRNYIFTEEELDLLIEGFAVPVWEARDEHEQALNGYVLACILDYTIRNKEREQKDKMEALTELRKQMEGMSFLE